MPVETEIQLHSSVGEHIVDIKELFSIEVTFTAPSKRGRYFTRLQLSTNDQKFGEIVTCSFIVVNGQAVSDRDDMENV